MRRLCCIAALLAAAPLWAQSYPVKPIRLVVGFTPGGGADNAARMVARNLTDAWGQSVVVDNRAGAGGNVATEIVAKSAPDGYTLLVTSPGPVAINPGLYAKLPFDPQKDLAPITLLASGPNVLVVPLSLPASSVGELIALARASAGKLNYASSGIGSTPHLSAELFKMLAKVDMVHVLYKGAAPAVVDLIAGRVDVMLVSVPTVLAPIKAQRLKALGVTSIRRSAALPDLPTLHEAGLSGYEAGVWWGLLAPAGTNAGLIARLNQSVVKILRTPEAQLRLAADGAEAAGISAHEFALFIRAETEKWSRVIKAAGLKSVS